MGTRGAYSLEDAIAGAEEAGRPTDDFTFTVDLPCVTPPAEEIA